MWSVVQAMLAGATGLGGEAPPGGALQPGVAARIEQQHAAIAELTKRQAELEQIVGVSAPPRPTHLSIFEDYMWVMLVAFLVTLIATPLMRRFAVANGVIDRPSDPRKIHRYPIAYLGGAAVFLGVLAGIFYSYLGAKFDVLMTFHPSQHLAEGYHQMVPISILLGMTAIMLTGLIDDVMGISPRIKIAGQLLAAAALAIENVGVRVAQGVLQPIAEAIGFQSLAFSIPLPFVVPGLGWQEIPVDLVYWSGTAIIAIFVLGACNASNLIDGLDGLLSGVTAIANVGLLIVAISLAAMDDGPRDAQRVILCLSVIGACLGFLPHNFNPASIFLGDCGSLLLGFLTITIVLSLGDTGKTHLVIAGLIIYSIPILDTTLAIIRRKMAKKKMSDPDDQHLHHMLKRALGVKGAAMALYALGTSFAVLGVMLSVIRARFIYTLVIIFASFIIVTAIKIARRKHIEEQAAAYDAKRVAAAEGIPPPEPAAAASSHAAAH
jgi:UDP-GlcNAc:undecaprenyl-phosphate/decaprenyl-phosphate GlcNAc-1-phosphate transferase